jgi:hypothetical protein
VSEQRASSERAAADSGGQRDTVAARVEDDDALFPGLGEQGDAGIGAQPGSHPAPRKRAAPVLGWHA